MEMTNSTVHTILKSISAISAGLLLLTAMSCASTTQTRSVEPSGFLKNVSQLEEGGDDEALLVYFNPSADWARYDKIILEPVTVWRNENFDPDEISKEDLQRLVDALYIAVKDQLAKDYQIVDRSGPGVLRMRVAITEADDSVVVMDTITNILPIGIGINLVTKGITGTSAFVGEVAIEAEILDSLTNERLAALIDERAGTKSYQDKFKDWGDVNKAFIYWAERTRKKLLGLRNQQ
jgi:hypothetical protein